MTAEYPKEQQNPPTEAGRRPEDQPPPRQRVPRDFEQEKAAGDPRNAESGWERGEHLDKFQTAHTEDADTEK